MNVKSMVFRCFFLFLLGCGVSAFAQQPSESAALDLGSYGQDEGGLGPRRLAPGVLTVVPATFDAQDTALGPYDLELLTRFPELAWGEPNFPEGKPNFASSEETLYQLSRGVTLRPKRVWSLDFAFKPVRSIAVEIPNAQGELQKRVAYYMIYSVRNPGKGIRSEASDANAEVRIVDLPAAPIRTLLRFQIVSKERGFMQDSSIEPIAKTFIEAKERVGQPLLDPIEMSQVQIPADGTPVWGVAIWMDVDPKADFFAVDVRGLTSAYRIRVDEDAKTNFDRKTLRIYHWRAGDDLEPDKHRIRLGLPPYVGPDRLEVAYNFNDREEVLSEIALIEMRLSRLSEEKLDTETLANTLRNASPEELSSAFSVAKVFASEAMRLLPEDSESGPALQEMVEETERAILAAAENRDAYRAAVSLIPRIADTSEKLIRSVLSVRLLYLRDLASELNKTLRMKDTLDKFNLEGRLDYQWVYR